MKSAKFLEIHRSMVYIYDCMGVTCVKKHRTRVYNKSV